MGARHQSAHLLHEISAHFPEACVVGYEKFIDLMTNEPNDRHVAAAAVKCNAQVVVTFNLKDFPPAALSEWDIEAQHPDNFLIHQYDLNPAVVISKLHEQASTINRSLPQLLRTLRVGVPGFAETIARKLELDLD